MCVVAGAADEASRQLWVAQFSAERPPSLPADWERLRLPNVDRETRYRLAHVDGRVALNAEADSSASAVVKRVAIDPQTFPVVEWSWRVTNVVPNARWQDKAGDDFAARLFVSFEEEGRPPLFGRMFMREVSDVLAGRALNYVWASDVDIGRMAPSPATDRVAMIVVQSGAAKAGTWTLQRRNVIADFRAAFGEEPPEIVGVALMTDTDDTGSRAVAYYGNIRFFSDVSRASDQDGQGRVPFLKLVSSSPRVDQHHSWCAPTGPYSLTFHSGVRCILN